MNKALAVGAIAVVLYVIATRTCTGKMIVARVRGQAAPDCGCGCTDAHGASASAPVVVHVELDKEASSLTDGCATCGPTVGISTAELGVGPPAARAGGELVAARPTERMLPPLLRADVAEKVKVAAVVAPAPLGNTNVAGGRS